MVKQTFGNARNAVKSQIWFFARIYLLNLIKHKKFGMDISERNFRRFLG